MRTIVCPALPLLPILVGCSVAVKEVVPRSLNGLCIATIENGGGYHPVNVKLSEFVEALRSKGFEVSWSGSHSNGHLAFKKDDQFANKTTEIIFETVHHDYTGPVKVCRDGLAVLARAKIDGEVQDAYNSEDLVLGIAEKIYRAQPKGAPMMPRQGDSPPTLDAESSTSGNAPSRTKAAIQNSAAPSPVPRPTPAPPTPTPEGSATSTPPAIERRYTAKYRQCMSSGDAANGITLGLMNCIGDEITRQDRELNQTYKVTVGRLDQGQRLALKQLERSWITERNARCQRESAPEEGGTLAAVIYAGCTLDHTIARTIWLKDYKM